jgi:polyphosphate kinase
MPRNLFERCEVVFPVRDKAAKARLLDEILPAYLADEAKARLMQEDGSYLRAYEGRKTPGFSAQEFLMRLAEGKADLSGIPKSGRIEMTPANHAVAGNTVDAKVDAPKPDRARSAPKKTPPAKEHAEKLSTPKAAATKRVAAVQA